MDGAAHAGINSVRLSHAREAPMIRPDLSTRNAMRAAALAVALAPVFAASGLGAQPALSVPAGLPDWAFNIPDTVQPPAVRPRGTVTVPGSSKSYEADKIAGNANPPDWFPDEHPDPPRVVAGGGGIRFACGSCHLMSGQGHSESADLASLPAEYLIGQMAAYKSGARKDEERMGPIAKTTSDEDVRAAADYFAALKPRVWVSVVETAAPPKTFIARAGRHRQLDPSGGTEPIGNRIIEIPADPLRTELRDPHSGFIAFVPPGSIAKGEALVKSAKCASCHGDGLKGRGETPRLAGLQPLYLARQLFDLRFGSRAEKGAQAMKPVVAELSDDDVIAISSYLGSLPPA
jgi:cytochrome c553